METSLTVMAVTQTGDDRDRRRCLGENKRADWQREALAVEETKEGSEPIT